MKKFAWKKCRKMFLEALFFVSVQNFGHCRLHEIIGLQLCQCLSANHNPELHWCYTFCTGVTLFAQVLHLNCTALSLSESSNFFMCVINLGIIIFGIFVTYVKPFSLLSFSDLLHFKVSLSSFFNFVIFPTLVILGSL